MKIRSKIMLGFYSILLPMVLFTTPTFAYDATSGNTEYLLNDEWSVVSNDIPNSTATGSRDSLTNTEFTIVFLETATTLTGQLEVYFGTDFSEEHPNSEHFVIGRAGVTLDLRNYMLYCPNYNALENNLVAFKLSTGGVNLVTYLDTYARIIYDSPNDILNNMVDSYEDIAEGEGFDDGYATGLANGELIGQANIYNNGSTAYGYPVAGSYDYGVGYEEGTEAPLTSGTITFMENFQNWIVPAILLVLVLGGAMTVIAIKKRNE